MPYAASGQTFVAFIDAVSTNRGHIRPSLNANGRHGAEVGSRAAKPPSAARAPLYAGEHKHVACSITNVVIYIYIHLGYRKQVVLSPRTRLLNVVRDGAVIRARDLDEHHVPRTYLARLVREGGLRRLGRGLYVSTTARLTEHHELAEAAKRVPQSVVCLLSALQFHGLTTEAPREVWIAIGQKARRARVDRPRLRIVHFSGHALSAGIEERMIEGVRVKVYNSAKTVADCFKFRNKIGLDVALEALRDYRRKRKGTSDDLWRFAKICRVANVMRPYLEAIG